MKRTTIYLDEKLYQALRLKSAQLNQTLTTLINDAIRMALRKDALDHEVGRKVKEAEISYRSLLKDIKSLGRL